MPKLASKALSKPFLLLILLVLIGFYGCVDRFVIDQKRPNPILSIPLFNNTTFEPLLEKALTPIFKTSLYERGWGINADVDQTAKVLVGQIVGFGRKPISLDQVGGAKEYRINMILKLALLDSKGGETGFSRTVEGVAEYIARSDSGDDRLAKDRAIREAGRDMAEQIANLLENFMAAQKDGRE